MGSALTFRVVCYTARLWQSLTGRFHLTSTARPWNTAKLQIPQAQQCQPLLSTWTPELNLRLTKVGCLGVRCQLLQALKQLSIYKIQRKHLGTWVSVVETIPWKQAWLKPLFFPFFSGKVCK